eukprot:5731008-Alexandrium_andersonii.AAC.1
MAVQRATERFAELLQIRSEALLPHKRNRCIMLAPGPNDLTITALAEVPAGDTHWRITGAGKEFIVKGNVPMTLEAIEGELDRASQL